MPMRTLHEGCYRTLLPRDFINHVGSGAAIDQDGDEREGPLNHIQGLEASQGGGRHGSSFDPFKEDGDKGLHHLLRRDPRRPFYAKDPVD